MKLENYLVLKLLKQVLNTSKLFRFVVKLPQSIIILQASGDYAVNETVTGGTSGNTGQVISWDSSRGLLRLKNVTGAFTGHETMTGSLSTTTGLMAKSDTATATVDVVAVSASEGRYVSEDGHLSETTMKIQDSLYYQDFSYVIKVGRTIDEWRDSFKKTMHPMVSTLQDKLILKVN